MEMNERTQTGEGRIRFRATNVVGDEAIEVSFDRRLRVGDVIPVLADRMMLSATAPAYALRSERLGRYLEDEKSIGDQVEEDEEVTLTPKTHLGSEHDGA